MRRELLAIGVLAAIPRLLWLYSAAGDIAGEDTHRYLSHATTLRQFVGFGFFTEQGFIPSAMTAPLYPIFVAIFYPPTLVQLVQVLLSSATVLLTYLLGKSLSRSVALIAGIGMALGPMSSRYSVWIST